MMSFNGKFFAFMADVEAALVLCAENTLISMPARHKIVLTHRAIVHFVTSLCGFM